ncbi:MAG: hypothetical protein U0163_19670 [Gemmatimonadaceae bacterium]
MDIRIVAFLQGNHERLRAFPQHAPAELLKLLMALRDREEVIAGKGPPRCRTRKTTGTRISASLMPPG